MKNRIMQLMKAKGMTQQEFAQATGISPAGLSNIFNGRTNPTFAHVQKIHDRFPEVNTSWLMFGDGEMVVQDAALTPAPDGEGEGATGGVPASAEGCAPGAEPSILASADEVVCSVSDGVSGMVRGASVRSVTGASGASSTDASVGMVREVVKYIDKPQRRIKEIRIFFDDGTYESFGGE